jgi:peptidoglycan/LPS O-acetylase OafA/YrhL
MNRQFTALRGVAMLIVVLSHTIDMGTQALLKSGSQAMTPTTQGILGVLRTLGYLAVPIFLFIAGTFVAYAARGEPPRLTWKFLRKGLSHVWWPYVVWSAVFYLVLLVQFRETYTAFGYVKNLIVGYPYNFVPLLLLMYFLSPLLVAVAKRHGWLVIIAVGGYQLLLLCLMRAEALSMTRITFLIPKIFGKTLTQWGVFFPLGIVYTLHMRTMLPYLDRLKWVLTAAATTLFFLGAINWNVIQLPVAAYFLPGPVVLLLPLIRRDQIPLVNWLETVGKRSYGLYLIHIIVLDLALAAAGAFAGWTFRYPIALLPCIYAVTLSIPLFLMERIERSPARTISKYVLG